MEKLFGSRSRVRILELLLFSEPLHLREIARRTKVAPPQAGRELNNLVGLGLAKKTRKGNLSLYRVNKQSPIYNELRRIFLKTISIGKLLADNIRDTGDIRFALMYGSFAAGDEREGSDIDLLIIGGVDENKLLTTLRKIEDKTGREANYILWTEKEFNENCVKKHHLLMDIIKKPIIGLIGSQDEFRRLVKGGGSRKG